MNLHRRYRESLHRGQNGAYLLSAAERQATDDPPAPLSLIDLKNKRNLDKWRVKYAQIQRCNVAWRLPASWREKTSWRGKP